MRLICPNCDAQYEVGDDAIPAAGRDVQCSNCGHGWFQKHPEAEAADEAEAALFDAPDDMPLPDGSQPDSPEAAIAAAMAPSEPEPDVMPAPREPASAQVTPSEYDDEGDGEPPVFDGPAPLQRRSLDESVLAVLREEAEREQTFRGDTTPVIETQTDMALDTGTPPPPPPPPAPVVRQYEDLSAEPPRLSKGRELLPDIEEINSTLRASNERASEEADKFVDSLPPLDGRRSGFRSGFLLMVVVAAVGVATYVMAPKLSQQFPAAAPALAGYVTSVDKGRVWLDGLVKQLSDLANKGSTPAGALAPSSDPAPATEAPPASGDAPASGTAPATEPAPTDAPVPTDAPAVPQTGTDGATAPAAPSN